MGKQLLMDKYRPDSWRMAWNYTVTSAQVTFKHHRVKNELNKKKSILTVVGLNTFCSYCSRSCTYVFNLCLCSSQSESRKRRQEISVWQRADQHQQQGSETLQSRVRLSLSTPVLSVHTCLSVDSSHLSVLLQTIFCWQKAARYGQEASWQLQVSFTLSVHCIFDDVQ